MPRHFLEPLWTSMRLDLEGRACLQEATPLQKGCGGRQEADLATAPPEAEELIQKALAQEQGDGFFCCPTALQHGIGNLVTQPVEFTIGQRSSWHGDGGASRRQADLPGKARRDRHIDVVSFKQLCG